MESLKNVDPFVGTPAGFSRNPPHCTLIGSIGYSAGRIPATPVQIHASWKTPPKLGSRPRLRSAHGEAPTRSRRLGYGPGQLGWSSEQRSQPGCFIFLGDWGGGVGGGGGGHFPARNPSRCRGEEAERKHKSVSSGPSKLAPVFAERSGSSASGTNGS